eukprot:TRINITY_DN29039_c0_g3_i1.p1 TRINITY_DN29039_c0_g3~~TRINITY_DN29039_c0_g3_i1.p1  ORF type:complete len:530 (+),score=52.94 TRINITY_DN29039_c0_g3_i1:67-1590(+)
MIEYDEGKWGVAFAFQIRGSVIPRAVAWALPCSCVTLVFHYFLHNSEGFLADVLSDVRGDVLRGFTFVLGFLIVFRAQKAYARWWEGGTLLQQLRGEWFNAVSNLIAFCNTAPEQRREVEAFQHQVVRLFSLLYGSALRQVSTMDDKTFEFMNLDGFDEKHIEYLAHAHDECELVVQWIQRLIVDANTADIIKIAPPILSRVYNQLGNGIVRLNNAKKIKDFPIPFPLAQMITFMLFIHLVTTSLVCATSLSSGVMAGVVSFVVIVSFWGVNYMAVELENPYGDDWNDLPLHFMQRDMNQSLRSLLHEKAVRPPAFDFQSDRDRIMELQTFDMARFLEAIPSPQGEPGVQQRFEKLRNSFREMAQTSGHTVENCLDGVCDAGAATIGNSQDSSYGDLAAMRDERQTQCFQHAGIGYDKEILAAKASIIHMKDHASTTPRLDVEPLPNGGTLIDRHVPRLGHAKEDQHDDAARGVKGSPVREQSAQVGHSSTSAAGSKNNACARFTRL